MLQNQSIEQKYISLNTEKLIEVSDEDIKINIFKNKRRN